MLLCIDIGNSNITLGLFSDGALLHTFRLQSRREQTSDEYAILLGRLLELHALAKSSVSHAIIASVVPALNAPLARAVERAFGCRALIVDSSTDTGIAIGVDKPREVGIDRIVNVAAARQQALLDAGLSPGASAELGAGAIVIDLGTATTLDCVSPAGEFVGGVIVPGMRVSFDALVGRTAQLRDVELVAPSRVLGTNTVHCLQSGIVYGYASLIDGLVAKLRAELPFTCRVLATGGLAHVITPHATSIERIDPDLTLRGLCFIHQRASARA
ncbi:MAG TPA: type III pantothenate kinase [Polyangiaceae bacterium]|nr:type III pantothenate kinase [Polyangiaceae bacterium]